jgi:hypothetical protein
MPRRVPLVTTRDPRVWRDWWIEVSHPNFSRLRTLPTIAVYENPLTYSAVRSADRVFVPAPRLVEKTTRKYRLRVPARFLPTPIDEIEFNDKLLGPIGEYARGKFTAVIHADNVRRTTPSNHAL